MLQLHMRTTDAAVILQAEGRLEVGSAVTVLRQATTRAVGPGVQTLELDLAGVTAIDAAGVGALVNTKIYCDRAGGRLVLLRAGAARPSGAQSLRSRSRVRDDRLRVAPAGHTAG